MVENNDKVNSNNLILNTDTLSKTQPENTVILNEHTNDTRQISLVRARAPVYD